MELASMLPGFRFLFTAIVLSMSVLIFGLGAAALLRSAHEEFANLPSRRATPAPMFARLGDDPPATLSMLRVDPPVSEKPSENVSATAPETAADLPAPAGHLPDARPVEPEKLAALTAAEPIQAEAAKPEAPATEASTEASTPAETGSETPVASADLKVAAIAAAPDPAAATPSATSPEATADNPPFEPSIATTLIATLGGPAVIIEEKASTPAAKPDRRLIRKRAAERARERRRIAAARRARIAREATLTLQAQQPNPFAFPLTPTTR